MSAQVEKSRGGSSGREEIGARFEQEGLHPSEWGNAPGGRYGWHSHSYHEVLYCVSGSTVFHTEDGDFELEAGNRLDIEPGTDHAATVGPDSVKCMEAAR